METFVFKINLSATLAAPMWGLPTGLLLQAMQKVHNLIHLNFFEHKSYKHELCQNMDLQVLQCIGGLRPIGANSFCLRRPTRVIGCLLIHVLSHILSTKAKG